MKTGLFTERDREDFEVIESERAPAVESFKLKNAEFYRWYEDDGTPRAKPLNMEELADFYVRQGYTAWDAYEQVLENSWAMPERRYRQYEAWCNGGRLTVVAAETPAGIDYGLI